MRFPYAPKRFRAPTPSRPSGKFAYFPMFAISLFVPTGQYTLDGLVDSAATDVIVPLRVASLLGLDLSSTPTGQAVLADGSIVTHRYASVELYLSDGLEAYRWPAIVGFLDAPLRRHALLGHAGFLDYFDVLLKGEAKETIVNPNGAFSGRQVR